MPGRFRVLTGLLPLLLFLSPASVFAHDLKAAFEVQPDRTVLVHCWYNAFNGPSPARGAAVEIGRPSRDPIKGTTNERGFFTFTYDRAEDMTIVVRQGDHVSRPVTIQAADLEDPTGSDQTASSPTAADDTTTAEARLQKVAAQSGVQLLKDLLLGVSLILAAAAFIMSLRNARRLREKRTTDVTDITDKQC